MNHSVSESEVWEVQYDYYTKSSNSNISSSRILPAVICSEDGILAVIEQGMEFLLQLLFVVECSSVAVAISSNMSKGRTTIMHESFAFSALNLIG